MTFRCAGGLLNSFPSSIRAPQLHLWQTFAAHRPGVPKLLALQYLSAYSIGVGSGGSTQPEPVILHGGSSRNGAERGSGTGIRTGRRLCSTTLPGKSCRGRPRRRRSHRHRHGPVRDMDQLGRNHLCDYTEVGGRRFRTAVFSLTVNFRSRDAPRWGRCTRGSNPAENRGTGTSSCSNAV